MIEPIMYFGIGFLVATLLGLVIVPFVHGRAVRLTMRRLEAATPLSMAEIQADKDQLRAEFAMSTRRLEMTVEQLKAKSTGQLAELGKKSDAINRLKIELGEKTASIFALEARDKELRNQLRATEEETAVKTAAMHDTERALSDKKSELAKLVSELNEQSTFADAQKVEIVALKGQIEALKDRLADAGREVKAVENRREAERVALGITTRELDDERSKVERLGRRVSELEQQLVAQTTEAQILGRRAHDMENRLTETSRLLAQTETELKHAQDDIESAHKTETDLHAAIAKLNAEKAELQGELDRTRDERDRLSRDLAAMKRETEEAWKSERVENSLLRERITDVAAEVARLASALEGPNSPIDTILAAETARDRAAGPVTVVGMTEVALNEAEAGGGNLADRIRALQTHASRAPNGDEPQSH